MKRFILLCVCCIFLAGCNSKILNEENSSIISPSSEEAVPVFPPFDVKYETIEPTANLLQKYNDLLSPFLYKESGDNMSDEEIILGFKQLYQSAHTVYFWYTDASELQQEVDESAGKIIDKQGVEWRPAKRIATLGEMYALVDSIYTQRYRLNALDSHTERFRRYNRQLYINCSSGGLGDPYLPCFDTSKVLAKTPHAILIQMDVGSNNDPTENPVPTTFTLITQGAFWVLDNWL